METLIQKIDNSKSNRLRDKYLKKLFDGLGREKDVDQTIFRLASWHHSHPSVNQWFRRGGMWLDARVFTVNRFLELTTNTDGKSNKSKIVCELYKYLMDNFWWVTLYSNNNKINSNFHEGVDRKALEIRDKYRYNKKSEVKMMVKMLDEWLNKYSISATYCKSCHTFKCPHLTQSTNTP